MSNDHVQVEITVDNVGITRQGYGMPMILSHNADFDGDLIRFYTSLPGVAEDFDSDSPEYLSANAFFAQTPKPPRIAIGYCPVTILQQYSIGLGASGPRDEFVYEIEVVGQGMESETISYTSDEDASDDEILSELCDALNDKADKTYTAVLVPGASDPTTIEVTANETGAWFSLELGNVAALTIGQTHGAPSAPSVADGLSAILLENSSWYELHTFYNSPDYVLDAAEWVQAYQRIYAFDTNETESIVTAYDDETSEDTGAQMFALGYSASMGSYHPNPAAMFSAAWMGRWLPTDPGQATAKFKTLEGVATVALNDTHKANLRARRMNSYTSEFSRPITWEGQVFSTVYRFLDVRRDVDWLTDEVSRAVFGVLAGSDKVPYTAAGIAKVEGAVRGSVSLAVTKGVLAEGTTSVEAPNIEDVEAADKSDRILRNVRFAGTLEGAVHAVIPVSGTVTF